MVTSTARQSVILKCTMQASVLLSNYEFYYAAGLFCKLHQIDLKEELLPAELKQRILPELKSAAAAGGPEGYLVKILLRYKILEDYDSQMRELFLQGLSEQHIWQVKEN